MFKYLRQFVWIWTGAPVLLNIILLVGAVAVPRWQQFSEQVAASYPIFDLARLVIETALLAPITAANYLTVGLV